VSASVSYDEFLSAARERFGNDTKRWAFVCPNCGDRATVQDFIGVGKHGAAGQECIGRSIPGRGCNWAAYGLIPGPVEVVMPDGRTVRSFALAEAAS
jgi:hypothetical protein